MCVFLTSSHCTLLVRIEFQTKKCQRAEQHPPQVKINVKNLFLFPSKLPPMHKAETDFYLISLLFPQPISLSLIAAQRAAVNIEKLCDSVTISPSPSPLFFHRCCCCCHHAVCVVRTRAQERYAGIYGYIRDISVRQLTLVIDYCCRLKIAHGFLMLPHCIHSFIPAFAGFQAI